MYIIKMQNLQVLIFNSILNARLLKRIKLPLYISNTEYLYYKFVT